MTAPVDPTLRGLDECGCCTGTEQATPLALENRPGLPAVAYRTGTHTAFKRSLLAALSSSHRRALAGLHSREDDDFSIALLDAWASVADILSFYSERIANESYLGTATERRSVLELARAIGYELNPGVAASTLLSFTVESAPGAPEKTTVPVGTRVQSVPKPEERAQTFETVEPLEMRPEWNSLRARRSETVEPRFGDTEAWLAGVETGLRPGDTILLVGKERKDNPGSENWDVRTVRTVEPDAVRAATRVTWQPGLGEYVGPRRVNPALVESNVYALRETSPLFGGSAPDWRTLPHEARNRYLAKRPMATTDPDEPSKSNLDPDWPNLRVAGVSFPTPITVVPSAATGPGFIGQYFEGRNHERLLLTRIDPAIDFNWGSGRPGSPLPTDQFSARWVGTIVPERTGSHLFHAGSDDGLRLWIGGRLLFDSWIDRGHTVETKTMHLVAGQAYQLRLDFYENGGAASVALEWTPPGRPRVPVPARIPYEVHVDGLHSGIVPGGWAVLRSPTYDELYEVLGSDESSRQGFAIAGKTTRVQLEGENLDFFDDRLRETVVLASSELLERAERPILEPVAGDRLRLDGLVLGLPPGRRLVVAGKRARVRITAGADLTLVSRDGRTTQTVAAGDELTVIARPDAAGGEWTLVSDTAFEGRMKLDQGRREFVRPPEDGVAASEAVRLLEAVVVRDGGRRTELRLDRKLTNVYDRESTTVAANVALATHGEGSGEEVLGSGDASQAFIRFRLRQGPLTYTGADTPTGGRSTLEVRVDDVRWSEVETLFGRGPRDRVYVTRREDDGRSIVQFGDGRTGARPPTGRENVRARYRKGVGREGNVDTGQLTLLMSRPLGVNSVVNPLPGAGGQDPEVLADARERAPRTVLTLGRIVSLRDYEDFARGVAGVAKASAVWTWNRDRRGVFLTVAGIEGAGIPEGDPVWERLTQSIARAADPSVPVRISSYRLLAFRVGATVEPDPAHESEKVLAAVESALRERFSFEARAFGQPVALSEVMAVVQGVPGVVAVDVDRLYAGAVAGLSTFLQAAAPRPGEDATAAQPAELLTLRLEHGDLAVRP